MTEFSNPFRPGAGHKPPYLAGRQAEREEFLRMLGQSTILENMVLTGLRGVGKTVLLDSFKPLAMSQGWVWVGTDLSESTSVSEDTMAIRLCTDLSPVTSGVVVGTEEVRNAGFAAEPEKSSAHSVTKLSSMPTSTFPACPSISSRSSGNGMGCSVEGGERTWNHLCVR